MRCYPEGTCLAGASGRYLCIDPMSNTTQTSRVASTGRAMGLAATATTLLALVAMSTAVSGAGPVRADDGAIRSDSPVVRVVAAVVVAVARDLARAEHSAPAAALLEPVGFLDAAGNAGRPQTDGEPETGTLLSERLLDLPPPAA